MSFTVVIPFYEGHAHINALCSSIPTYIDVIVVNDLSSSPVPKLARSNIKIIDSVKKGYFTGAVNVGINSCKNDVLILNQDSYFKDKAWINFVEDQAKKYSMFGEQIGADHPVWGRYVHGTFMYIRRDAIATVGLLDEVNYPLWGSTCDWQVRARRKNLEVGMFSDIPSFIHKRSGVFGDSIQKILAKEPQNKNLLIRTPPLVSVVVPCYNYGKFLKDLVNSLIGGSTVLGNFSPQTFQSFEIIICDDGSSKEDQHFYDEIQDVSKGIRVVHRKNGGTAAAVNTAIKNSHSNIVTRIDADDMRETYSLQNLYDTFVNNQHSMVFDNVTVFNSKTGRNGKAWDIEYDFDGILYKNTVHAGIMFSMDAWKETGGYPEIMDDGRDDWAFNIALGIKGYCGVKAPGNGYLYRRDGHNRTLTNTTPLKREVFLSKIQSLFPDLYAGRYPMACCGGRRNNSLVKNSGAPKGPAQLPGALGVVTVKYLGGNFGTSTFYGAVTGVKYTFSAKTPVKYVDIRDAHTNDKKGILDLIAHGRLLFQRITPTPVKTPDKLAEVEKKVEVKVETKVEPKVETKVEPKVETKVEPVVVETIVKEESIVEESIPEPVQEDKKKIQDYLLSEIKIAGLGKTSIDKLSISGIKTLGEFSKSSLSDVAVILGWRESKVSLLLDNLNDFMESYDPS